eukprot:1187177-Prymnesium_polylepis.1
MARASRWPRRWCWLRGAGAPGSGGDAGGGGADWAYAGVGARLGGQLMRGRRFHGYSGYDRARARSIGSAHAASGGAVWWSSKTGFWRLARRLAGRSEVSGGEGVAEGKG